MSDNHSLPKRRFLLGGTLIFLLAQTGFSQAQQACTITGGYCTVDMSAYAQVCAASGHPTLPICIESLDAAAADAKTYLMATPAPSYPYMITIQPGSYDLSSETKSTNYEYGAGVFNLGGISPPTSSPQLRLVIKGAGQSQTFIKTSYTLNTFAGVNVSHITIENINFSRDKNFVTQGTVVSTSPPIGANAAQVVLAVPSDFPTPDFGLGPTLPAGTDAEMRLYDDTTPSNPRLITTASNGLLQWTAVSAGKVRGQWNFAIQNILDPAQIGYVPGAFVCLKAEGTGQSLNFIRFDNSGSTEGTDIQLIGLILTQQGRMAFNNFNQVNINHVEILRGATHANGQAPCLSTDAGGPQIAGKDVTYGNTISYYTAQALADDALAFFQDAGGTNGYPASRVSNSTIEDSFVRFIEIWTDNTGTNCGWNAVLTGNTYLDVPSYQPGTPFGVKFYAPLNFEYTNSEGGRSVCP